MRLLRTAPALDARDGAEWLVQGGQTEATLIPATHRVLPDSRAMRRHIDIVRLEWLGHEALLLRRVFRYCLS